MMIPKYFWQHEDAHGVASHKPGPGCKAEADLYWEIKRTKIKILIRSAKGKRADPYSIFYLRCDEEMIQQSSRQLRISGRPEALRSVVDTYPLFLMQRYLIYSVTSEGLDQISSETDSEIRSLKEKNWGIRLGWPTRPDKVQRVNNTRKESRFVPQPWIAILEFAFQARASQAEHWVRRQSLWRLQRCHLQLHLPKTAKAHQAMTVAVMKMRNRPTGSVFYQATSKDKDNSGSLSTASSVMLS